MVSEEHWNGLTCNNCFNQDTVLPGVAGNHFEEVAMTAHQGTTLPKTNVAAEDRASQKAISFSNRGA